MERIFFSIISIILSLLYGFINIFATLFLGIWIYDSNFLGQTTQIILNCKLLPNTVLDILVICSPFLIINMISLTLAIKFLNKKFLSIKEIILFDKILLICICFILLIYLFVVPHVLCLLDLLPF